MRGRQLRIDGQRNAFFPSAYELMRHVRQHATRTPCTRSHIRMLSLSSSDAVNNKSMLWQQRRNTEHGSWRRTAPGNVLDGGDEVAMAVERSLLQQTPIDHDHTKR